MPIILVLAALLETYQGQGFSLQTPKGWKVTADVANGKLVAQQDPARPDAAMLVVMVRANAQKQTADQVLDTAAASFTSGFKVIARKGNMLVAEGTQQNVVFRVAVVAQIAGDYAEAGVLVAKAADFDALGGAGLASTVLASLQIGEPKKPSGIDAAIEQMKRAEKRADHGDLDPARPALEKAAIVGSWGRGSAMSMRVEDARNSVTSFGHTEGQGEGEAFTFRANGTYQISKAQAVNMKYCQSSANQLELGTYTFDGKTLVLTVKSAAGDYVNCGAKPAHEAVKTLPKPRSYDVGVAADGWLILVGPACGAFPEVSCPAHAGWEMHPSK